MVNAASINAGTNGDLDMTIPQFHGDLPDYICVLGLPCVINAAGPVD
jgi:hypothetical protein